jgi:hypothetical protein
VVVVLAREESVQRHSLTAKVDQSFRTKRLLLYHRNNFVKKRSPKKKKFIFDRFCIEWLISQSQLSKLWKCASRGRGVVRMPGESIFQVNLFRRPNVSRTPCVAARQASAES